MRYIALFLLAALPAFAQDIPQPLRGTFAAPDCANATSAVQITPRSIVRMAMEGDQRLVRATQLYSAGDWVLAIGEGDDAPRVLLRGGGDALELAIPDPKTRDDQLPGNVTPTRLQRCTEAPLLVSLHAEGLAFLHALEAMEPVCEGGQAAACLGAFFAYADVTKDGKLSPAEITRALRGVTWAIQMSDGTDAETLAAGYVGAALAGVVVAQLVVPAYDYDQSGSLSMDELTQDRMPVALMPPARTASVAPLPLDALANQLGALREALQSLPALLK